MLTGLQTLWAVYRTRHTLRGLRSRGDIERLQAGRLRRHLARIARTVPFYARYAGRPLSGWPTVDKAAVLASFGELNSREISAAQAWEAAELGLMQGNTSGSIGRIAVGTSTGTSGNRGLFLVSRYERARWLGSLIARALPDFPRRDYRVLVMLATGNELYDTAARSSRLCFKFLDLRTGVASRRAEIERFEPDIVVAPPKALRAMADIGVMVRPVAVFSGGEVLDPIDATAVEARYGCKVKQIYQATEGFLGVSCEEGTLHLNEDSMVFEFEEVAPGHVMPVVTDLFRTTQAIVRYRLNDVLVLGGPCRCGSPLTTVRRIEGRMDDVLSLPSNCAPGTRVIVMPDTIRTAVMDADRSISDFRAVQTGERALQVHIPVTSGDGVQATVRAAVEAALSAMSAFADVDVVVGMDVPFDRKLRRVIREWPTP